MRAASQHDRRGSLIGADRITRIETALQHGSSRIYSALSADLAWKPKANNIQGQHGVRVSAPCCTQNLGKLGLDWNWIASGTDNTAILIDLLLPPY